MLSYLVYQILEWHVFLESLQLQLFLLHLSECKRVWLDWMIHIDCKISRNIFYEFIDNIYIIESKWYIVHKLTLGSEILYFDKETTDHRSYASGKHSFCSFPWDLSLILRNVLRENVERCLTLLHGERILDRPQHTNSSLKTI